MLRRPSVRRIVAKYKDKKEVPKSDGKGTTTVYEYGPRQVAKRHKDKAVRIEALRKKMGGLRQKARADLTASDPETRLTALAVCLMDETYERVGNDQSAKDGHYGVTNWTADHITLSDKAATIRYTGKSGVKHEKKVTNARVLSALRKALKGKGKGDKVLCDGDECSILAKDVNAYLKPYGITAKDIRGFHANEEMKHHLKAQRKSGPSDLPHSRKEKDEILKAEFQAALDLAAAAVGHEASTLRSQYLVPSMEASYFLDGTVIDKLDKKASRTASWMKVKRFFPGVRNPVFHATTGPRAASIAMRGEGIKSNSGVSNFGAGNMGSISLSRDLNFLLKGGFGNVIFVLDRDELNRKFPVNPHAYPNWEDEYEERVFTDKIPPSMIRGVILRYKPIGFELDEWESKVDYPVAYIDGRAWGSRTAAAWDRHPDGRLLGYKVMGYDPETRQLFSGADSRQRFPLRRGVHRMRAPGIFLAASPSYVLDYYAGFENNALLTYAFDAADVTTGNLGDREPEITVSEAELVGWSLYDEDMNPLRVATLSDSEKEGREDEAQVRQSPKLKPPRTDKERRLVKDRDNAEDDPDMKQDQKDRSRNFKDASARVALRYLLAQDGDGDDTSSGKGGVSGKFIQFMEEEGDTKVKSPATGNDVKLKSLKGDKGRTIRQEAFKKWLKKQDSEGQDTPSDTPSETSDRPDAASSAEVSEADARARKEVRDSPDMLDPARPLSSLSLEPLKVREGDEGAFRNKMADRSVESMRAYLDMDSSTRSKHRETLESMLTELDGDGHRETEQYAAAQAQLRGLAVASALEDGDDAKGVNQTMQKALQFARKDGRLEDFVRLNITGASDGDESAQTEIRKTIESVDSENLKEMLPEGHPGHEFLDALNNETFLATMDSESQDMLRRLSDDMVLSEMIFTDMDLVKKGDSVGALKKQPRPQRSTTSALSDFFKNLGIPVPSKSASRHHSQIKPHGWDFAPWREPLSVSSR